MNKTQVKELAGDYRVSSQFYDAIDSVVAKAVKDAKKRAESNGRSTLMPHDL